MNLKTVFVALGLAMAGLGVEAPALADHWDDRHYRGYHGDRWDDNRYDRWDRRDWRDDRRYWKKHRKHWRKHHYRHSYYGWNDRRGRDCWREWHHGRRVTVCNYR